MLKGKKTHKGKGIRELLWVKPEELQENPYNWRIHNSRQMKALSASIETNGWAGALLYNETTGRLIDGHARKSLILNAAKRSKSELVPVLIGEWTEEEEKRLLATLDPIAAMAEIDTQALRKLTQEIEEGLTETQEKMEKENREAFKSISVELRNQSAAVDLGAPASFFPSDAEEFGEEEEKKPEIGKPSSETEGSFKLKGRDEIHWDSWGQGSTLDIPHLLTNHLGSIPEPITTWIGVKDSEPYDNYLYVWGSASIKDTCEKVVPCFYTEDFRFNNVWETPAKYTETLLKLGVKTIISPNFSCYDGMHLAEDIWQTYKARWLSRYWQEAGLHVIPDLMLGNLVQDEVWKWRFAGIPKNVPAVALQVQQKGEVDPKDYYRRRHRQLLRVLDILTPQSLLLYHGPNLPDWFVSKLPKIPVVKCLSFMSGRSKVMRKKKTMGRH